MKESYETYSINSGNFNDIYEQYEKPNSEKSNASKFSLLYKIDQKESYYFICNKCHFSPMIIFDEFNLIDANCECREIKYLTYKEFMDKYSFPYSQNIEEYFYCRIHKVNKYECYCVDCKSMNLCQSCNKNIIHKYHTTRPLLDNDDQLEEVKKLIDDIDIIIDEYNILFFLIKSILEKYKDYPSYNLHETIKNAKALLLKLKKIKKEELVKVNSIQELQTCQNSLCSIKSIIINEVKLNDLSIFKNGDFINLEYLELKQNFIESIEPLVNCNFENLKKFILSKNKLNYKGVMNLDKMNFKSITIIDFYINEIKSVKIFEKIIKFTTLEEFHIGGNMFDEREINEIDKSKNNYDLSNLLRIGLTGSFSDRTIHFVLNLKFNNLIVLYISRNNLSSLDFLDKISCPKLKSIWAITNNLTDYNDVSKIKYKDEITNINLKENKISNIDNLSEFISNFPKLKYLYLTNNEINLENPKNIEIIKEVEKKYDKLKLVFDDTKYPDEY